MEHNSDVLFAGKTKNKSPKTERRRSSIFGLLKRQKKLTRQFSEPAPFFGFSRDRTFSVDAAILSDFKKMQNGGYKMTLDTCRRQTLSSNGDAFSSNGGSLRGVCLIYFMFNFLALTEK